MVYFIFHFLSLRGQHCPSRCLHYSLSFTFSIIRHRRRRCDYSFTISRMSGTKRKSRCSALCLSPFFSMRYKNAHTDASLGCGTWCEIGYFSVPVAFYISLYWYARWLNGCGQIHSHTVWMRFPKIHVRSLNRINIARENIFNVFFFFCCCGVMTNIQHCHSLTSVYHVI